MVVKNIWQKLADVQINLNAPKNQRNDFGKYDYRSCEDILAAAKPLCIENGLVLTVQDEIVLIGERYYVEAIATVIEISTGVRYDVKAKAREPLTKKGMDEAQITGSASSYSRKYALNGLFAIDDSKDSDTNEYKTKQKIGGEIQKLEEEKKKTEKELQKYKDEIVKVKQVKDAFENPSTPKQTQRINILISEMGVDTKVQKQKDKIYKWMGIESLKIISSNKADEIIERLLEAKKQKEAKK